MHLEWSRPSTKSTAILLFPIIYRSIWLFSSLWYEFVKTKDNTKRRDYCKNTLSFKIKIMNSSFKYEAVHKRRHQSWGEGGFVKNRRL